MFPIICALYNRPIQNIHERKSAARLTSLEINPILRDINRAKHK